MPISSMQILKKCAVHAVVAAFAATLVVSVSYAQTAPANSAGKPPAYPLKVSSNHRYLVDQNGSPFLIVGDTPQGLMGRLSEKDAEYYFADREARGFNALGWIDVMCAGADYRNNTYATTPDGIRP